MATQEQAQISKRIEALSAEQLSLCEQVAEEYIGDLASPTQPDTPAIERWLDVVYGLYEKKRPDRIEIAASPQAALALASSLTGSVEAHLDYCGIGDGGWVAFYDFFSRAAVLTAAEAADFLALRAFMRVAWDTVLLDDCAIVLSRPTTLKLDDGGNLHCADGPCIQWADGQKDYCWHGTWVKERIILDPRSYTREEFLAISNTEERRALAESGGWDWVAKLLDAASVDVWVDPITSLKYELYRCPGGETLLAQQSPPLKGGAQPQYIEPVHEDLRTAQAARKWQATRLSPAECESDPGLVYGTEA